MAFWRGGFYQGAFWTGDTIPIVFDNPQQVGPVFDFDAPTALGVPSYIARPLRGEITATGFASVGLVRGFVVQTTRAEIEAEGFAGGIVTPATYNAIRGEVSVEGRYPGSGGKDGGLLEDATDPDADPLSFQIMSQPTHGTLAVEFNGAFLYTPTRGFSGQDSFTWRPWANGLSGNTVTVSFVVEPDRVVLPGEVLVSTFAPVFAGFGLNAAATRGEVTVTGFASVGLSAGFQPSATRGDVDPFGLVPTFANQFQALLGEVTVTGLTGIVSAGWQNRATIGVGVEVEGLTGVVSIGFLGFPTLGSVEVEGFVSTTVGIVGAATLAEVTVTGYAPHYLELPLTVSALAQVTVSGFVGQFNNVIILPPTTPERPPDVVYYNPRNHVPAGQILDRETDDVLMAYWASVGYRVLTTTELEIICGNALPTPVIKREFGTGEYPRKTGTY